MTLDPFRHFAFQHLPRPLQEVSRPFFEVAHFLVDTLKQGPERNAALRKLLEAKDCAVRAAIDGGALAGLNRASDVASRPSGLAAGDLADRLGLGYKAPAVDPLTGHALPPGSPYSAAHEPVRPAGQEPGIRRAAYEKQAAEHYNDAFQAGRAYEKQAAEHYNDAFQAEPANVRQDCTGGRGIETADKVYPYHPEMFREMACGERDPIGTVDKIQHVDGFEYAIDAGGYVIARAPMYKGPGRLPPGRMGDDAPMISTFGLIPTPRDPE